MNERNFYYLDHLINFGLKKEADYRIMRIKLCLSTLEWKWFRKSEEKLQSQCDFCIDAEARTNLDKANPFDEKDYCKMCLIWDKICSKSGSGDLIGRLIVKYPSGARVKDLSTRDYRQVINLFADSIRRDINRLPRYIQEDLQKWIKWR